jgi:hypothetical protein
MNKVAFRPGVDLEEMLYVEIQNGKVRSRQTFWGRQTGIKNKIWHTETEIIRHFM